MTPEFQKWLNELDALALDWDAVENLSKQTGTDCWKEYFEGGHTPEEALAEDWSYD